MRTTLDLPEELLERAMHVSNTSTKTKVIILALEELVRKSTITELRDFKGAVDLEIDLDRLRERP
jgi:Arc/MetJ family transcription regulator